MREYKYLRKKEHKYRKSIILLISVSAMMLMGVGASFSFLKTQKGPLVNEFASSYVTSEVIETFKNNVKSDVRIQNTGDIEAYIRAAVIATWKDENGNVYPQTPIAGTDYIIKFSSDAWDKETPDNYYYYTKPVAANGYTEYLIEEVTPIDSRTPKGYVLSIEILGDAIQSLPEKAVVDSWGVTVNLDGTIGK